MQTAHPWRSAAASVIGTAHTRAGLPCQDAHALCLHPTPSGEVLIAVVADGAGSAERSREGAQLACDQMRIELLELLDALPEDTRFGAEHLERAWDAVRATLEDHALTEEAPLGDFACTLLTVVALPDRALIGQLGDGAIVLQTAGEACVPVWPQQGAYANTTFFLTGEAWREKRVICSHEAAIDGVVLFTDGLQALALSAAGRVAEPRFVAPLLAVLAGEEDTMHIQAQLVAFLHSERVNARTDDDKTLVLAWRGG